MAMTRFSINAILWFGNEMKKMEGHVPGDDEEYLSCIYPSKQGMANCWNGDCFVSHFAFFTQRDRLDQENILDSYGEYLSTIWKSDKRTYEIYKSCIDSMLYVDQNVDKLPEIPYRQIMHKKTENRFVNIIKNILPYYVVEHYLTKRRESQSYIEDRLSSNGI